MFGYVTKKYFFCNRKNIIAMRKLRSLLIVLLLTLFGNAYGQSENDSEIPVKMLVCQHLENDSVLSRFNARFDELDTLLDNVYAVSCPMILYGSDSLTNVVDSLYKRKEKYEVRAFRRNWGLELTGQIYQRLDGTFGLDEDEDQYSRYSTKLQAEIGWDFFHSSLFQRRAETRYIRLSNELQHIGYGNKTYTDVWERLADSVTMRYEGLIAMVLYQRLVDAEILDMAYQYMLEQDKISNEGLMSVMNDKMDIEYALLQIAAPDSFPADVLLLPAVTIVEVDTAMLFSSLESNNTDVRVSQINVEMLAAKRRLTNYWQEVHLTPFIRASRYLGSPAAGNSTNIDAGIRFSLPLYNDITPKRRALRSEKALVSMTRDNTLAKAREACTRRLDHLARLNRSIAAEDAHLKQLAVFIKKRQVAYKNSRNGYNYIMRMEEYDGYLKSLERLYRLMLSRNLCLLEIQKSAGGADMSQIINEM